MQKEVLKSCEGFLKAALTVHGHPGPLQKIAKMALFDLCMELVILGQMTSFKCSIEKKKFCLALSNSFLSLKAIRIIPFYFNIQIRPKPSLDYNMILIDKFGIHTHSDISASS